MLKNITLTIVALAVVSGSILSAEEKGKTSSEKLVLTLRKRVETKEGSGRFHRVEERQEWDPQKSAVIVCDI